MNPATGSISQAGSPLADPPPPPRKLAQHHLFIHVCCDERKSRDNQSASSQPPLSTILLPLASPLYVSYTWAVTVRHIEESARPSSRHPSPPGNLSQRQSSIRNQKIMMRDAFYQPFDQTLSSPSLLPATTKSSRHRHFTLLMIDSPSGRSGANDCRQTPF